MPSLIAYLNTLSPEAAIFASIGLCCLPLMIAITLGELGEHIATVRFLRRFADQATDARIAGEGW